MPRPTVSLLPSDFVTGSLSYYERYSDTDTTLRIVLPILLDGQLSVEAIVDTGTPWCIFPPETMAFLGFTAESMQDEASLSIRGMVYNGYLVRMMIRLEAEQGDNADIDATVFVPDLHPDDVWDIPHFIGLDGLLNRIRFAVDPQQNMFYFGE